LPTLKPRDRGFSAFFVASVFLKFDDFVIVASVIKADVAACTFFHRWLG
jgi:hypothetical protein